MDISKESVGNAIIQVLKANKGEANNESVMSSLSSMYRFQEIRHGLEHLKSKRFIVEEENAFKLADDRDEIARTRAEETINRLKGVIKNK